MALPWPIDKDSGEFTLAVFDMAAGFDAGDDRCLRSAQTSTLFERMGAQPGERWRGLLRLALQPDYPTEALVREVVIAIDAIANAEVQRADVLTFQRLVAPELKRKGISNPAFANRSIPLALRNARLAPCLTPEATDHGDAWAIMYVAQTCVDLLMRLEESGGGSEPIAVKLMSSPNLATDLTVELADQLQAEARAEQQVASDQRHSVIRAKHMRLQTGFSLFACERWLEAPDHPLAWLAAIAIAKTRARRDRKVMEPLLHAVRGDDEALAAQAEWILSRGTMLVERARSDTNFEDMGFDTLLWLGHLGADPAHADLRSLLSCIVADVAFCGSDVITQLFVHLDAVPEDREAIAFLLKHLTWTDIEATRALASKMRGCESELQAGFLLALGGIDLSQRTKEKQSDADKDEKRPASYIHPIASDELVELVRALGPTNDTAPFRIFPDGGASLCTLMGAVIEREKRPESRVVAFKMALDAARIDIRDSMSGAATVFDALDRFLGSKCQIAGQDLPFRHNHQACHELRKRTGPDAVRLAAELLVELSNSPDQDYELAGLVATLCFEYALVTPSLLSSSLKACLGGEAQLMAFFAALIENPPRGISIPTAVALACLLRHLDESCVKSLIAVSTRPDLGRWALVEQSLVGVGRVEPATLPLLLETLARPRPRTVLLAIRLLGLLTRDAGADTAIRRSARQGLEAFAMTPAAASSIHIYMPATRTEDEGCILSCGQLADIVATELFYADGFQ